MINNRIKLLRYTVLCTGLLGLILRAFLYATAIDAKGLLIANHWATWAIVILTGLVLVILGTMTPKNEGSKAYEDHFPASICQGTTSLFVAVMVALRTLSGFSATGDSLELAGTIFGLVTGVAMAIVGVSRFTGKRPNFLCHSALCIFLALQMISQYRHWSAEPQLMHYCFYLLAFLCLMITAYFLAGFEADMGNRRGLLFFSITAGFFCLLALPESGDAGLLIACALWAFCCGPQDRNKPRRHRPVMQMDEETEDENS